MFFLEIFPQCLVMAQNAKILVDVDLMMIFLLISNKAIHNITSTLTTLFSDQGKQSSASRLCYVL